MTSSASRSVGLLLLTAFIVASVFGATHSMGMEKGADGKMSGCMFSGTAICTMTPLEHLAAWQSMFTAAVDRTFDASQLLFLAAVFVAAFLTMRLLFDAALNLLASRQRLYLRYSYAYAHRSPLQEAFSRGILNPKIY